MTNEEQLAIMQAFISGKDVEYRYKNNEDDNWDFVEGKHIFDFEHFEYRIAEEPKEISLYEEITFLNDFVNNDNMEMSELQKDMLRDVIDYADGCYVNHCEEVGKIAIENIEEMKQVWLNTAYDWFKDNARFYASVDSIMGFTKYDVDEAFDCFTKYMEKNG